MKIKKTLSEAQLAQRRANAEAQKAKGKKRFVTINLEPEARDMIRDYVRDPKNKVSTLSEAVKARFR